MTHALLIITFFLAFIHRVLSGIQSGFLYHGQTHAFRSPWRSIITIFLAAFPWMMFVHQDTALAHAFQFIYLCSLSFKTASFYENDFRLFGKNISDIHLWENVTTGSMWFYLALSGNDIVMLCCSVYPSLILHKGFINMGNDLPFFDQRTDDATGKIYSIPVLGIKIPRTTLKFRLVAAFLSIILAAYWVTRGHAFSI